MRFLSFVKQSQLIEQRLSSIDKQVTTLSTVQALESLNDQQINRIKLLSTAASQKHAEFEKIVNKLFSTTPLPEDIVDEKVTELQDKISDLYINISSLCSTLIPTPAVSEQLNQSTASSTAQAVAVPPTIKLPSLDLGKFSGQPDQWMSFHSIFENAVHTNESLSNIEKFTYLLSCLSDEPLSLVKSLPLNAANYAIAWQSLIDRYHNTRLLITLHTNNILDLPQLTRPTVKQLRKFLSVYNENYQALKTLGHDIANESLLLTTHILRKFDSALRTKFEHSRNDSKKVPTINELILFLENKCTQEEAAELASVSNKTFSPNENKSNHPIKSNFANKAKTNRANVVLLSSNDKDRMLKCIYCSATTHIVFKCPKFGGINTKDRFDFIKSKDLCVNCFGMHKPKMCKSKQTCLTCSKRHHTLLHFDQAQTRLNEANTDPCTSNVKSPDHVNQSNTLMGLARTQNNTVLLATALVKVSTHKGNGLVLRAVLDSASQTTLISESCANILNVKRSAVGVPDIKGISVANIKPKGFTHLNISSLSGSNLASSHPVLILDQITSNLPRVQLSPFIKAQLKKYMLADPTFDLPGPIDLLIGADLFPQTLLEPPVSMGENLPFIMRTIFGFVVLGAAPIAPSNQPLQFSGISTLLSTNDLDLHATLQRFWSIEEPPQTLKISPTDAECEKHFLNSHSRDNTGRYICRLPFKESPQKLGLSAPVAKRMFNSLENKFAAQPDFKMKYVEFMQDYETSGHMEICESIPPSDEPHFFLPHHGVFKGDKLRVVFNSSVPTSTGISLNSLQHQGPKLHNDPTDIIFRFRQHKYVFTCDIKQMFRQILIHEDDRKFQLIYWRKEPSHPIKVYQLTTVTYGMSSSPYLANRVIQQLMADEGDNHPLAAKALQDQIYVDDALLGCDTLNEALDLQQDVIDLLLKGGFQLRKWSSNNEKLLENVPLDHRETPLMLRSTDQPCHSVLGLKWIPQTDKFSYAIPKPLGVHTKRALLSFIAQIYDPMGLICPLVFWAKALMQHIWCLGLEWDTQLPETLSEKWSQFISELSEIDNLKIPRYLPMVNASNIQLHGFSDASESGYASCVFLRLEDSDHNVSTHLLIAKSKVAPLKRTTIPRLELCGAHLLAKLLHYCINKFDKQYHITAINAWSDSMIALSWIHTPSYKLKLFVANRVAQIQELTPSCIWRHVSSAENPADCASRGLTPSALMNHELWWSGPKWLKWDSITWPQTKLSPDPEESLNELKSETFNLITSTDDSKLHFLSKYSSWSKLVNVMAYVLRFIKCLKLKAKITTHLTKQEFESATNRICWCVQKECFANEIKSLQAKKTCSTQIQRLAPFLDEEGIIRVGGRLKNSPLKYSAKHPILLPKNHFVVHLLIDFFHKIYLHAGPQLLQAMLMQNYWILSQRSVIRSRIFKCIRCFKAKPKMTAPLMGDLPAGRVTATRCFNVSAMDYAGPFTVKVHILRRLQPIKVYLCLFICFATKAVHLEMVTDLSADAFIASLTRFTARRGTISDLYSDCATNFIGTASTLKKCFQDLMIKPETQRFAQNNKITFHFIPPRAPHQGGLWERAIKSAKYHLKRVIGTQILTYEEFLTLIARVESMLNSRPITPLSADPSDLEALTPGHFLTGGPLTSLIEPHLTDISVNRLKRWKLVHAFAQHIWNRWHREYLQTLQERSKWITPEENLKIGDLVIIHEDNTPPLAWMLGRIISASPGQDGTVRVVQIKTSTKTLTRPVVKVSRLPIN